MVVAGDRVALSAKREGQELLDRELGKLCYLRIFGIDRGRQCGARRQYRIYWIFEAPIVAIFRNISRIEIKREELRQLLDSEWAGSYCNAMEGPTCEFPVCAVDLLQYVLICRIEGR